MTSTLSTNSTFFDIFRPDLDIFRRTSTFFDEHRHFSTWFRRTSTFFYMTSTDFDTQHDWHISTWLRNLLFLFTDLNIFLSTRPQHFSTTPQHFSTRPQHFSTFFNQTSTFWHFSTGFDINSTVQKCRRYRKMLRSIWSKMPQNVKKCATGQK